MNIRDAFLARSQPGSEGRAMDQAVLEIFDNAGLGDHPGFLAMLDALVNSASLPKLRKAKARAYKLLEAVNKEHRANLAEQVRKAEQRNGDSRLFFQELLDSVETLSGIADEHGSRTLGDLMYLHAAVMNDSSIDHYPGESMVLEIASALPSGEKWAKYIKVEYMKATVAA